MGEEISAVVNESCLKGFISEALNSTYLTLIPKKDKPVSFNDFRPISLCNILYKIISKTIAERIKPFLALAVSREQFGFLHDRQIMDAVGVAQECIHSVKVKDLSAVIMKIDLEKAYDRVDWDYL